MYKMLTDYTLICRFGTVQVFIRLVFNLKKPIPSEEVVLSAINNQLAPRFRIQDKIKSTLQNSLYHKLSENSFSIDLYFKMINVPMEVKLSTEDTIAFTNKTITQVEGAINSLLHDILLNSDSKPFMFPPINFIIVDNELTADVLYKFNEDEISHPSNFLTEILEVRGPLTTTFDPNSPGRITVPTTSLLPATPLSGTNTSMQGGGRGFPGWALAIIIPCGIVIILIPLWILLCCMLCGCCAALRRRWRRRRSYIVQYTTHNSLF
ncbi:hypothetical protein AAFF_G00195410 [Aldrovandia affinis]|uniref:Uncharacterized protein n=1 Tax=Aldrovandia affinis TaxID=143900 RepID=A0AAD7WVE4_9TELE|nr:hypothetical protein AAFF_G00195410 [Aldrovandia affinis]